MRALVRAEFVKLSTTRMAAGLTIGAIAVAVLGAVSTITSGNAQTLAGGLHEQMFFLLASINLGLFAMVLGTRAFTDEFRHGSIVPALLVTPGRARVLGAKALAFAVAGALLVATAVAVMVAVAIPLLRLKGVPTAVDVPDLAAMGGLVTAGAQWAVIGVAVGAAVRHQVAAVVGAIVWVLVVENLGAGLLRDAGRFLPGQAGHALARASQAGALLEPVGGMVVMATYALLVLGVAAVTIRRVDVAAA